MVAVLGAHRGMAAASSHRGASHCAHPTSALITGPSAPKVLCSMTSPWGSAKPLPTGRARGHIVVGRSIPRPVVCSATLELPLQTAETHSYRFRSKGGLAVDAWVYTSGGRNTATVHLSQGGLNAGSPQPQLHWGMYRSSLSTWQHPKEVVPQNSYYDEASKAMRSPMRWDEGARAWAVTFEVPPRLLPVSLAVSFFFPDQKHYEAPLKGQHFVIPVGMSAGDPAPYGASVKAVQRGSSPQETTCSVNFSLFSRHASAVNLCLVRVQRPSPGDSANMLQGVSFLELALDPTTNRSGDMWHVCVHGLRDIGTMCWGWRADGDITWENGGRFHPGFVLCDPYAARVVPVLLPEGAHRSAPRIAPKLNTFDPVMLGSLSCFTQTFNWEDGRRAVGAVDRRGRRLPLESTVVVELDVVASTTGPEADKLVRPELRGKYLGVLERVQHIKATGATTVALTPVMLSGVGTDGKRSPISFFAPETKFSSSGPLAAADELRELIKGLHSAGLEVLLEVEYCITAEGWDASGGKLQGMRGIDAQVYYRGDNTVLNSGHPVVRQLVVDSLRHLATEYQLDGFVLLVAENLAQDRSGTVLDYPPLAEDIVKDPLLSGLKMVAAVSDTGLLPRNGVRGFPHFGSLCQWNERFTASAWAYLAHNTHGMLSDVATRLTGSADLFAARWDAGLPGGLAAGRRPASGVNFTAAPGSLPLMQALDPDGSNPDRAAVLSRTMLMYAFVSLGMPGFSWSSVCTPAMSRFVSRLAKLRAKYSDLLCTPLYTSPREVKWHAPTMPGVEPDWSGVGPQPPSNVIACTLVDTVAGQEVYIAMNPYSTAVTVVMPSAPPGYAWRRLIDTSMLADEDATLEAGEVMPPLQTAYTVAPYAGIVMDVVPSE